jgi:hypothetical protein
VRSWKVWPDGGGAKAGSCRGLRMADGRFNAKSRGCKAAIPIRKRDAPLRWILHSYWGLRRRRNATCRGGALRRKGGMAVGGGEAAAESRSRPLILQYSIHLVCFMILSLQTCLFSISFEQFRPLLSKIVPSDFP